MMVLHDFALSSASYRVRIALNLKGLAYQRRNYQLRAGDQRTAAYLALNPAGLVPMLEVDGQRITQSLAIIDYLEASHPEPRLIPLDPYARARALELALSIACDIHPLNNLRVLLHLQTDLGQDPASVDRWYRHWVAAGFAALEARLGETPDASFAGGEAPGLADLCLVPQIFNARRYQVDLAPYPRLVAIADRAAALPAFRAAAPATG